MLNLLDILFTLLHIVIILFNVFGWISPKTRRLHFLFILLTAASWFILGIWFGVGYCPVTDWQWNVKRQLGEQILPPSFIEYYAEKISGNDFSHSFINKVTIVVFLLAALLSVYFNFVHKRIFRQKIS